MTRLFAGTVVPCFSVLFFAACAPEDASSPDSASYDTVAEPTGHNPAPSFDNHPVLAFLNAPDTTYDVLDLDVRLDRRAAQHIVRHRDGDDRVAGTADDNLFQSLDELLELDWVGPSTIELVEAWLADAATDGQLVEGVAFTDDEAILVVSFANTASAEHLDIDLDLDVRAAEGIVAARPIASLQELATVPFVGPATLERLRSAVTQ
jgi:hypothetical protein